MTFSAICSQVEEGAPAVFTDQVQELSGLLLPFLTPRPPPDPLSGENNYTAPDGILDLYTPDRTPADWFRDLITSPFLDAQTVIDFLPLFGIQDGQFSIPAETFGGDPIPFDIGFADINITFTGADVFGMDSFTLFGPPEPFGMYTIGYPYKLAYVATDIHLKLDIRPQDTDTVLFDPEDVITENVTVTYNATDIDGYIGIFIAIIIDEIAKLPPNTFDPDCLFPTFDRFEMTVLNVTKGVSDPQLTGFSSAGTGRLAQRWEDALWLKYEDSLLLGMPNIMQEVFRPLLNTEFINAENVDPSNCAAIADGTVGSTGDGGFGAAEDAYGQAVDNVNDFGSGSSGIPNYGQAVDNVNDFGSGGDPNYGLTADNVNGFGVTGDGTTDYGHAVGNVNNFGPGQDNGAPDYGQAVDGISVFVPGGSNGGVDNRGQRSSLFQWGPLKRLQLPRILPRASFFHAPNEA